MSASPDNGLIRRGFFLLGLITALVVVVLGILFQRTQATPPVERRQPEVQATALIVPTAFFPASVAWASLYELGQDLPSATGWEIRYNAAWALARRGSDRLPWDLFREMLDEGRQMRNFRVQLADGRTVPDEAKARETVLMALRALAEWHQKRQGAPSDERAADRAAVYAAVDALAASPIALLKVQAEKTRETMAR